MFRPLIKMYERRTIFRTYLYSFQSRRKCSFFEICSIFALWFFSFFVFDSSVVGQDLVPFIVTSDLNANITINSYPVYIIPNIQGRYNSTGTYTNFNNISYVNVKNDSSSVDWSDAKKGQFWRAFCDRFGYHYCLLSDILVSYRYGSAISSEVFTPSDEILISVSSGQSLSYFLQNSSRQINSAFFVCGIDGVVYYRLTPVQDVYDVFFFFYPVASTSNRLSTYVWSFLEYPEALKDYFIGPQAASRTQMNTFIFCGQFRVRIRASSFAIIDDDSSYSLPLQITDSTLSFCSDKNYYWKSYGSSDKTATDYVNFPSYDFTQSRVNLSNWPYYSTLFFSTVNSTSSLLDLNMPNLASLDTDNGGMTDFHEWFQTKHDLMNPADDTDITEELEPEKPELPEPEEGEEVVDIGKDTQDRYGAYWDEKTGDDEELPELNPPDFQDLPSPAPRDFYFWQVTTPIEQAFQNEMKDNKFKQKFDQTFDDFTANDAEFSWVINPSVNSSLVQMPLPSISIAPKSWIQDPVYGPYFRTFRACLLLVEFLLFMYKMYKLAVASLSGGPISADTGGDDDD